MNFRIADTFAASLARLTDDEGKVVKTTTFDPQLNPPAPGLSFHKLDCARDKQFWSVWVRHQGIRPRVQDHAQGRSRCRRLGQLNSDTSPPDVFAALVHKLFETLKPDRILASLRHGARVHRCHRWYASSRRAGSLVRDVTLGTAPFPLPNQFSIRCADRPVYARSRLQEMHYRPGTSRLCR